MNIALKTSPLRQLYPLPGAKSDKKYNFLSAPDWAEAICQPFMGSAARSVGTPLPSYLGDINAAHRSIVRVHLNPRKFCAAYHGWIDELLQGLDRRIIHQYRNQGALERDYPQIYRAIRDRWCRMRSQLFDRMSIEGPELAGQYYAFLRCSFGQVVRLNPTCTSFNSAWHIDKISTAVKFSPEQFCLDLAASWIAPPSIYSSWQFALVAPPNPARTHLIIDPPYWVDGGTHKMTPCYIGHKISYKTEYDQIWQLATEPIAMAIDLGYTQFYACNYYSVQLHDFAYSIAATSGYNITAHFMGPCNALGNSNRKTHGGRKDGRDRPVEVIYRFSTSSTRRKHHVKI